jgi:hypothetical protein
MTSHPEIILCQTNSRLEKIKNSRAKTYRFSNTGFSIDDNNIIYQIALQILGEKKRALIFIMVNSKKNVKKKKKNKYSSFKEIEQMVIALININLPL